MEKQQRGITSAKRQKRKNRNNNTLESKSRIKKTSINQETQL